MRFPVGMAWRGGVDSASLVFFRVAFGLLMLHHVYVEHSGYGGFRRWFVEPDFLLTYYGFGWVRPLPAWALEGVYAAQAIACAGIAAGAFYRVCAVVNFLATTYFFLLEKTLYLNHGYLLCLIGFLLILLPLHRRCSVDAWLRPQLWSPVAPRWCLWLLRFQVGVVYFFGGLAKLNADWLRGEPMRTYLAGWEARPYVGMLAHSEAAVFFFTAGGLLLDLLIVPALLYRPTRMPAFLAAMFFHLSNAFLFHIAIFPWLMIAASTLYFDPDWPLRLPWCRRLVCAFPGRDAVALPAPNFYLRLFLWAWVLVQALVPFRHHLYPGDASWTEEGHNFAWRMMLRHKHVEPRFVWFRVEDPATGKVWHVDAQEYLPHEEASLLYRNPEALAQLAEIVARDQQAKHGVRPRVSAEIRLIQFSVRDADSGETWRVNLPDILRDWQTRIVCLDPDLILQVAHEIARREESAGRQVEVYAEVWASLHGRPLQLLIDAGVNLARQPRNLWPKPWIMPLGGHDTPSP